MYVQREAGRLGGAGPLLLLALEQKVSQHICMLRAVGARGLIHASVTIATSVLIKSLGLEAGHCRAHAANATTRRPIATA